MTLAEVVAAELPRMRAEAEALMLDTATARRPTGNTVQDEDSWTEEPEYEDLFETRCKVTGGASAGSDVAVRTVNVGGVDRVVLTGGVHVPIPAQGSPEADLRDGDELVITAIGPATDPGVLENVYRVVGFGGKSWATARRLDVVEV